MVGDGFKALSDPTRRRILEPLGERDMAAGEIGELRREAMMGEKDKEVVRELKRRPLKSMHTLTFRIVR